MRIPLLDGVRGVACLIVITAHFAPACCSWIPGRTALLAFFVMSGFLITWVLTAERDVDLTRFYKRRALRMLPAFYVYWLFGLGFTLSLGGPAHWDDSLTSLIFISNYTTARDGFREPFVGHLWSVALEEQFYLVWPIVYKQLARGGPGRVAAALIALTAATWIWRFHAQAAGAPWHYLFGAFECRTGDFAIGCLLAVAMRARLLTWQPRWWHATAAIGLLALRRDSPIAAPLLVAAVIGSAIPWAGHAAYRWLDWGPLAHLGRISYGVYLYHICCLILVQRFAGIERTAFRLPLVIALSIGLGWLSHRYVEAPFLAARDRGLLPWKFPATCCDLKQPANLTASAWSPLSPDFPLKFPSPSTSSTASSGGASKASAAADG